MKWLKFYFRCFVIACTSFKQNSWNGNYFSKLWGGVSVFTGMNQPCEWNEQYAKLLLSGLCMLQANIGMRTNKLDSALKLIFNHSSVTESIQGSVQFASSSYLVHVRFTTLCSYPRLYHMCQDRVRPSLSASESEQFWLLQCDLSRQTHMAKTNRCWFCCICAWCLLLSQTNHPNGLRPSFRPKH